MLFTEALHVTAVEDLPRDHAAPFFRRILIAQPLAERLRLQTHNSRVARYSDTLEEWGKTWFSAVLEGFRGRRWPSSQDGGETGLIEAGGQLRSCLRMIEKV